MVGLFSFSTKTNLMCQSIETPGKETWATAALKLAYDGYHARQLFALF